MVAGASGLALLIFLFVPWYGLNTALGPQNLSAWSAFGLIDLVLFLVAGVAIGLALTRAAGALPPDLPAPPATILAGAGGLAAVLVLFRIFELPEPSIADAEISRKAGVYLGLLASAGVAIGGLAAMSERSSPYRRRRR